MSEKWPQAIFPIDQRSYVNPRIRVAARLKQRGGTEGPKLTLPPFFRGDHGGFPTAV
jgi:hypothetical protein